MSPTASPAPSLAAKVSQVRLELNLRFPQRKEAIDAAIFGILTGQHVFLLGPPGTAKSLLARSVVEYFPGARYFEVTLSKSRPDAAVLGPIDLNEMKASGAFIRKDAGYLTDVDIAFLDEVGKMSPTTGHDILSALNERIKHEVSNGRSAHRIPLRTAITASNELPAAESEDAAALWDRLLLRATVDYLKSTDDFGLMLTSNAGSPPPASSTIPFASLAFIDGEIANVTISQDTLDAIISLRATMRSKGLIVSDRRWRDSMIVLKASAWLEGRDETEPEDVLHLGLTLWEDVESISKVSRLILSIVSPAGADLLEIGDDFTEAEAQLLAMKGKRADEISMYVSKEFTPKLFQISNRLKALDVATASASTKAAIVALTARIEGSRTTIQEMLVPKLSF